jgi:hypothetical protein
VIVEATSPPAIFFLLPGASLAVFGFMLVWGRLLRGFLLLLSRVIKPSSPSFFVVYPPLFSRRHRRCSVELSLLT